MVSEEQPNLFQSPIDIYLSSPEFERVLGIGKYNTSILRIEKDDAERYLLVASKNQFTTRENNQYEAFLDTCGNRVFSRNIQYGYSFALYPTVLIEGYEGDLEWRIERACIGGMVGGWRHEGFQLHFSVIVNDERHKIDYITTYGYHGANELEVLWLPKDTAISRFGTHTMRFAGVFGPVWSDEETSGDPFATSALEKEIFDPVVNYSYHLEREEIEPWVYNCKMITKNLDSGRQINLTLPSWGVDIKQWDEKIRVLNRRWRDLGKQMPISLEIIG